MEYAAKFRSRSFNNTMLISVQHYAVCQQGRVPHATPTYVFPDDIDFDASEVHVRPQVKLFSSNRQVLGLPKAARPARCHCRTRSPMHSLRT